MWDKAAWLHQHHGDVPTEARLLKLAEETGEAAEAWIGMMGLNSRKGVCKTKEDLLDELSDVIVTAVVAMIGVAGDHIQARHHFEQRVRTLIYRLVSEENRKTGDEET